MFSHKNQGIHNFINLPDRWYLVLEGQPIRWSVTVLWEVICEYVLNGHQATDEANYVQRLVHPGANLLQSGQQLRFG